MAVIMELVVETTELPDQCRAILFERDAESGGRMVRDMVTGPPHKMRTLLKKEFDRLEDSARLAHGEETNP